MKEHWITQMKEDYDLKPSGCAYCGCKELIEDKQGWSCKECDMQINAVSYYQGANAKALEKIRPTNKIHFTHGHGNYISYFCRWSMRANPIRITNDWKNVTCRLCLDMKSGKMKRLK